ncbi:MAG: long-chain fatty acid--CoA ligase [Micavibrio aeruginosavorus]|uniref:Long-chain fatty acid--CoA ligase n=1 Tax=Micavibrio aeruginosavorus TaxID=349221 RepID=A0A7T5UG60_9BACT|nr:MAG: long-chain fatty acid--CoA ligase [Micavibrio aeruginosavorus]
MQHNALASVDNYSSSAAYAWQSHYPAGIKWDAAIPAAPVYKILDDAAAAYPARPAINCEGEHMTYAELGNLVNRIACGLQNLGVTKGIKVGLFLPNTPYTVAFYYGILKAGGTVVNYNPLYVERELIHQIEDSETDYLVTTDNPALFNKADHVLNNSRLKGLILCPVPGDKAAIPDSGSYIRYESLSRNDGKVAPLAINPHEDIAVLQYTGGTTGSPKGAMLTHANLYANMWQIMLWHKPLAVPGQERIVCVLPLFHVFAMTVVMNMSIQLGMEIIIVPKFVPTEMINLLKLKQPTFFPAVPAIYNALTAHPASADLDLSHVKFCLSGGAPLPGGVKKAFEERTGAKVGEGYGLTEASPVVTCNPIAGKIKVGSIGMPIPGTLVEIISIEDGKTTVPVGEHGEVCISGPQVMKGYYNKPEDTASTIRNGRLHTGDVGYIDSEGYVHLVDRLKDLIIVRGYNVYPTQVEEAISMHPSVQECIVAGVPDEERGETVWAWIKPKDGQPLTEQEVQNFLQDKISPIEIPRKVIIRDTPLPKTAVGKLSRKLLLEEAGLRTTS